MDTDRNRLGTKAETLQRLYQRLEHAVALPQYTFTVEEWETDSEQIKSRFLSFD